MGKTYPGQAKPDLVRKFIQYNPDTGEATEKWNTEDQREYHKYYDTYFDKCRLINNAECRDNTFSANAMNAQRQGRMQAVNQLNTNMINPYSVQPIILDNLKVGDTELLTKISVDSNIEVLGGMLDYAEQLLDGRLVAQTKKIEAEKLELKPLSKIINERLNSKALLYYIITFLTIVITIVLLFKYS